MFDKRISYKMQMHIFDKPKPFSLMHDLFARAQSQNYEFKRAPKLAIIDQRWWRLLWRNFLDTCQIFARYSLDFCLFWQQHNMFTCKWNCDVEREWQHFTIEIETETQQFVLFLRMSLLPKTDIWQTSGGHIAEIGPKSVCTAWIWDWNLGLGFGTWIWDLNLGLGMGLRFKDLNWDLGLFSLGFWTGNGVGILDWDMVLGIGTGIWDLERKEFQLWLLFQL